MTQQIDIKLARRIETGKLQIGNDFPGYYIRSEDCRWLYLTLHEWINTRKDTYPPLRLSRLLEDFIDELRKV